MSFKRMISSAPCVGKRGKRSRSDWRIASTRTLRPAARQQSLSPDDLRQRDETGSQRTCKAKRAGRAESPSGQDCQVSLSLSGRSPVNHRVTRSELRATVNHHSSAEGRSISSASNRGGLDPHCRESSSLGNLRPSVTLRMHSKVGEKTIGLGYPIHLMASNPINVTSHADETHC